MVNRLIKIAVFTGAAHVFTIITLKFLSQRVSAEDISLFGEVDSLFQLIINFIAMGLQLAAVREIATVENWRAIYYNTQTARITMSIMLMPIALLFPIKELYIYFLLAPVFALSGDYALYARAKPVFASALSFFRVILPPMLLIIFTFINLDWAIYAYVLCTIAIYLITNQIIANALDVPLWFRPSIRSIRLYMNSLALGLTSIFWYILGLGLIIIIPYFYNAQITAFAYIGLKIYMVFKGLLRMINQAFIKEMLSEGLSLKVDQLCILAGITFVGLTVFFPATLSNFLLGSNTNSNFKFFLYLSLAGLVCSLFISYVTRAILFHKDKLYAKYSFLAASLTILILIILSFSNMQLENISLGLLVGESCLAVGLILIEQGSSARLRISFLMQASLLLLAILPARLYWGDNLTALITGFSFYFLIGILAFYKKFSVII